MLCPKMCIFRFGKRGMCDFSTSFLKLVSCLTSADGVDNEKFDRFSSLFPIWTVLSAALALRPCRRIGVSNSFLSLPTLSSARFPRGKSQYLSSSKRLLSLLDQTCVNHIKQLLRLKLRKFSDS